MKTLLLLRHAKSSWDDPEQPDIDRPLSSRGKSTAPRMGALMAERGWIPDHAFISPQPALAKPGPWLLLIGRSYRIRIFLMTFIWLRLPTC